MTFEEFKAEVKRRSEKIAELEMQSAQEKESARIFIKTALGVDPGGMVTIDGVVSLVDAVLRMKGISQ